MGVSNANFHAPALSFLGTHEEEAHEPQVAPRDEAESPRVAKHRRAGKPKAKWASRAKEQQTGAFQPVPKRARRDAATDSATGSGSTASAAHDNEGETASIAHHPTLGATPTAPSTSGVAGLANLQENLKEALNAHLAAMTPSQQLALWQLHQQQQAAASMQQALSALGMGGGAFGAGLGGGVSPALLAGLFGSPAPSQSPFGGLGGLAGAFGLPPSPAPANPSLSQVMAMMQALQQQQGGSGKL